MASKYVDISVLQYAVQSLSQSITNTFAMKNATVTSIDIVKAIPTLLIGTSTEQVYCLRVTYADNGTTLKDGTVVSHIVDIALSDIIADSKLKIEIAAALTDITDPQENVLYLISSSAPDTDNLFDEYIYQNGAFELVGSTKIDLSAYITTADVNTKLADYYTKTEVDGLIPDVSDYTTETAVNTKLADYYKKTETYNQTEIDNKFVDYYKKLETYSKDETDAFLKDKADASVVDTLSSKVSQIFSSMVDNTTLDGIVQDIKEQVANKLEDSDLNVIRSDIKSLQTRAKNLEDNKLDKIALPTQVSVFENDAKYQTDDNVAAAGAQVLADAKTYTNNRIADINTLDPEDYYNKTQVDNKLLDHYLKTETYNKTELDTKFSEKAGLGTATDTENGLLSAEMYSILKDISPDNLGKNGEDGLTPECEIKTVKNVHTITFTIGDNVKSFTVTDGVNGTNGVDGVSFLGAKINTNNHLIITLSNNKTVDVGNVDSHALDIHNIALDAKGNLIFTMSDGVVKNVGNVRGEKGKSIAKVAIDDDTHEIIVTYDDGTTDNAGMIEGVKGDKGDKGDAIKSMEVDENEHIIVTYADNSVEDIGQIKGAKGDTGTSVKTVASDKNSNLIVTLSDGTVFNVGKFTGPDGRGIKSVGVNGDYELILTMTDNEIINAGKLEVNVKDIFVTKAELNDDGELIFTFSDGTTQNNGKISGVEGFSIREYKNLTLDQEIKPGCMILWENMIYKVVTNFNCTTNFSTDKVNMQKITTNAVLTDMYNEYLVTLAEGEVGMTFDEWMHQWCGTKFDNPTVSFATIDNTRARYYAGSFYNLAFTNCVGGEVFKEDKITLPRDGVYLLVVESGNRASATRSTEKYTYVYNVTKARYEYHTSTLGIQSTDYNMAYPGITYILNGKAGDVYNVKVKNRYETGYGAGYEAKIYLYNLVSQNHAIDPEDIYKMYLSTVPTGDVPMTKEEWMKAVYQRDSFRMEGVLSQDYTDSTDILLTGFEFSNGNEDLMCDNRGRFYAPYSGMYYIRLQLRLEKTNNYPSRFYLIKNGLFGEEGYSSKVITQSTEGYQTSSAFLQSLNSVFWLTKGDYFTIGFQSSVKDTNTLKTISNFEYGVLSSGLGGSGGGGDSGGSVSSGIQLYNTIGIGSLVRENAVIQYQRRLYRVTENFFCTNVFSDDKSHMIQFYGSGHGITDYDDNRIDPTEEFLPGEFIIKRHQVDAIDDQGEHYTADVDDLYEVITAFRHTDDFERDKVNLKKVLGSFDDYDTVIRKLEEKIDSINHQNDILQEQLDDLAAILDDINRTVV